MAISKPYTLSGAPSASTVEQIDSMFEELYKFLQTPSGHNILSTTHTDTVVPITIVEGDLMVVNAARLWARFALGTANTVLRSNGTDPVWGSVVLTTDVTGTLPVTNGGTGLAAFAQGDLIYASATNVLSALAKNTSSHRYLSNGGTGVPSWATVDLSDGVTGTLLTTNGGTGVASYAVGDMLYYGGSVGTLAKMTIGAANTFIQSGGPGVGPGWSTYKLPASAAAGDTWYASSTTQITALAKDTNATRYLSNTGASNIPAWAQVSLTTGVTGVLPIANGGLGAATFTNTRIPFYNGTNFVDDADLTFVTDTLTATKVVAPTSLSTPSIITASGALTITPAAGSNINLVLSTTGDFAVNTSQFYVDTSTGFVGIGSTGPLSPLFLNTSQSVDQSSAYRMVSLHTTAVSGVFGCRFQVTATHTTGTMGNVQPLFVQGLYGGTSATAPAITNIQNAFFRTGIVNASPSGTVTNGYAVYIDSITNAATGTPAVTFANQIGIRIQNQGAGTGSGGLTVGNAAAIVIVNQSLTTNNSNLVIGASTIPTGNWSIYNDSTYDNYLNGRLGLGLLTVTALLHIKAGTATASTAPLKFTSGTNLTVAEAGAMEYNGTNLFFSPSTTRMSVWVGNDGASAPTSNLIGAIVDYYGASATRVLTTPNSWASVVIAGTTYKIPLYT